MGEHAIRRSARRSPRRGTVISKATAGRAGGPSRSRISCPRSAIKRCRYSHRYGPVPLQPGKRSPRDPLRATCHCTLPSRPQCHAKGRDPDKNARPHSRWGVVVPDRRALYPGRWSRRLVLFDSEGVRAIVYRRPIDPPARSSSLDRRDAYTVSSWTKNSSRLIKHDAFGALSRKGATVCQKAPRSIRTPSDRAASRGQSPV